MYYKRVYDFAAVQIAPSLRNRPRKSGLFTGAWRTTQTRPFHATSPSNTPCHDMRLHVRELNRRIPLYWMVGTRPGAHCRLRGGLFLPVYEPSALLQAACAMICHLTCVSAASICAGSSGKPPPVKYVRVTIAKSPRSCDPSATTPPKCSVLAADHYAVVMACICDELGARHVTRRPWQLLRATRFIVRTSFPVSYGCAERDWPAIGVYHT